MCVLCVSNPLVDWHALDAEATEPSQIGTAQGGTSNGTSVGFNQDLVDQLDSGSYWYNSTGAVAPDDQLRIHHQQRLCSRLRRSSRLVRLHRSPENRRPPNDDPLGRPHRNIIC